MTAYVTVHPDKRVNHYGYANRSSFLSPSCVVYEIDMDGTGQDILEVTGPNCEFQARMIALALNEGSDKA